MANSQGQKVINTVLKREIVRLHDIQGLSFAKVGKELGIAAGTVKTHYYLTKGQATARIPESPYPRYNEPPTVEGDALIIPDAEIPFHHAEFFNRVLDIADAWGIRQVMAAGDLLHFDSLSGWEPSWVKTPNGGLSADDERKLIDAAMSLPKRHQGAFMELIADIGGQEAGGGFDDEMHYARKTLGTLDELFDSFTWILGNHEGRLLRAINSPVQPSELLNLMKLDEGKWTIAPYYFGLLVSGGETYRIEHPKTAAKYAAEKLASKFHQHILMGHSHALRCDYDASGKYHACQIGHMVNEELLAYAAQRSTSRDAHKLGAAIVRDGYLWVLDEHTDWERMKKL